MCQVLFCKILEKLSSATKFSREGRNKDRKTANDIKCPLCFSHFPLAPYIFPTLNSSPPNGLPLRYQRMAMSSNQPPVE